MRHCLAFKPSCSTAPASSPTSQGNTAQDTPTTSGTNASVASPTVNLSREYAIAVQTSSYNEVWSTIHVVEEWHNTLLGQVLQPDHDSVQAVLDQAPPTTFTQLVTRYFEHSENICHFLVLLLDGIHHARSLYAHLHKLIDVLPNDVESMTDLQCSDAFDTFIEFKEQGNPFQCPSLDDMRLCFSQLKQQVDQCLERSRARVRRIDCGTTASAVCFIGTVVGVTASAIAIGAHALLALAVAAFSCPLYSPSKILKKERLNKAHLEDAAKDAFVLHNYLITIGSLVSRLHAEIDGNMKSIKLGLGMGRDKYVIHEVLKHLRKNRDTFNDQLKDLEVHITLCFDAISKARSHLHQGIQLHRI